jgi:hypothetical protein
VCADFESLRSESTSDLFHHGTCSITRGGRLQDDILKQFWDGFAFNKTLVRHTLFYLANGMEINFGRAYFVIPGFEP